MKTSQHPNKKYIVRLSSEEHDEITAIMKKGTHPSRTITRAHILLRSHEGETDAAIVKQMKTSLITVKRVRARYHKDGLHRALYDAPRPGQVPKLDTEAEAHLVAIASTPPPEGADHWTLELLKERMIADKKVHSISTVAIWHHLNDRGLKPWREKNVVYPDNTFAN